MGASSRMRTYQFLPLWEKEGVEVEVSPFFNEDYLNRFYQGERRHFWNIFSCYLKRIQILFSIHQYDLIWVEKELFPFVPAWAEWFLNHFGKGYVVDYDDAVFHNYDMSSSWWIRTFLKHKIDRVMSNSHLVLAGNKYIQERAIRAGAKPVEVLPTVINPERYSILCDPRNRTKLRVGWIGSPSTLKYLLSLQSVFKELNRDHPELELLIVNSKGIEIPDLGVSITYLNWEEEREVEYIQRMDIGIMPLPDDPWEQGKCAYKLIQYMACGLPVVASPVGMNVEVVKDGENGFLATTEKEWIDSLKNLIVDPELRRTFGKNGRGLVEENFTLERNFERMKQILISLPD